MKFLIVASLLTLSTLASASIVKVVSCNNPRISDAYITAEFKIARSAMNIPEYSVKLHLPAGEFQMQTYEGSCFPGGGIPGPALSLDLICKVKTGPKISYTVALWTKGGLFDQATIQRQGQIASNTETVTLPKCVVK